MSLYQKGLLAFVLVILIAVGTIALLVGQRTEAEFRNYALLYSGRAQALAALLESYYQQQGAWDGLQASLPTLVMGGGHGLGGPGHQGMSQWNFQVVDAQGQVVAHWDGVPSGTISQSELERALPLEVSGKVVGYLLPDVNQTRGMELGAAEEALISRVHRSLIWGALVAFLAALLVGGVLMRGVIAPVRQLTQAAQRIREGDLQVRAPVQGNDEITQLSGTFNAMAQSLEDAEAARRAQTADIAHELRNPLAVLQGTLEALVDGIYPPTPENLLPTLDQVRTLNRLVEDLRTLALVDAGKLSLEKQSVDPATLLSRVVEAHRAQLEEAGLTLASKIPGNLPRVRADLDRLAQVVGNILGNALRYVPAGGKIQLSAETRSDGLEVRFADNGPGVPREALTHLFERFWRGEPSRSRGTGGSGLGLAIAYQIIEAHGGRIWAEPTPGGGLTVAFWLPVEGAS